MSDLRCYEQNYKGNVNGNCGYNRLNQSYKACGKQDTLCGMMHCTHLNEKLEFGMESAAILARSFITVRGKIFTCRSAIVDLGLHNADPGLTPNGAKCADGKVCVNQKCVPIDSIKGGECPFHCSSNGVCNNKGNCHCLRGYGPPFCNTPGPGGSIDSGPASDPGGYVLVVVMYVIFLGIVPLMVIAASAIYYFRPHFKTWWITKARKANIKCRAKHTAQRKPQPPSKFNFDRNSLRTLEISSPIQQLSASSQNNHRCNGPSLPPEFSKGSAERPNLRITEVSNPLPYNLPNTSLQHSIPVPVRPAPPRPDVVPQHTPSWKPPAGVPLPPVIRTSSFRGTSENVRPVSLSASRPNCPPPRPPPPKPMFQPLPQCNINHSAYEDLGSNLHDVDRSSTPNSTFYDDCQTLDFSNTSLAFVHQPGTCNHPDETSIPEHNLQAFKLDTNKVQEANLPNRIHPHTKTNKCASDTKPLYNKPRTNQASVVASLAQKFEPRKKKPMSGNSSSSIRPSVKLRPLPATSRNNRV